MTIHQIHFERKFYLCKKSGYWISCDYSKERPRIRAHQWVWINHHGPIPKGYHVHHRNENRSDNSIQNLELIHKSRHLSHHMQKPERRKRSAEICNNIRPLTKAWHASPEGLAWHRLHAIKCKFGNPEPRPASCEQCSKTFMTKKLSRFRFCSNSCKSAWRRDAKLDHINKICVVCAKQFPVNRYSKTKCCSRTCGGIFKRKIKVCS